MIAPTGVRSRVPWHATDPVVLYLGSLAGIVMIAVSWYNASGTDRLSSLVAWVNLGVAGVVVSGTANALWLLSGRRAVGERRRTLLLAWSEAAPVPLTAPDEDGAHNGHPGEVHQGALLVSGAGMTRFHRDSCLLVAGKTTSAASREHHVAAGLLPCGICQP